MYKRTFFSLFYSTQFYSGSIMAIMSMLSNSSNKICASYGMWNYIYNLSVKIYPGKPWKMITVFPVMSWGKNYRVGV